MSTKPVKMVSNTQIGFTLIELMITFALLAIIASIAIPSFSNQIAQKRTQKAGMQIVSIFNEARSSAALANRPITLKIDSSNQSFEVVVGNKVAAQQQLEDRVKITSSADSELTVYPNGSIEGGDNYFRVCDAQGSEVGGYSVWINARGVAKYGSGKMSSSTNNILNLSCE